MTTRHTAVRMGAGLAVLPVLAMGWAVAEAHSFVVREQQAMVLPPGSEPIRVLHISDLHLLARQTSKIEFVRGLARLHPDLVVNTGDNFCSATALEPLLDALAGLLELPGVFVFGSNDYAAPAFRHPLGYVVHGRSPADQGTSQQLPTEQLRSALTEAGWLDLNDASGDLSVAGSRLSFRGTDDAHLDRDHYAKVAGPASRGADLNVGVTHAPYQRVLDAMTTDGMDIIFAGHTHGGQVCLPWYGALITNCDIEPARVKGLSTHSRAGHTAALHVSAGLGTSPFAPYRTFCRPEVTLLTLVARDAELNAGH